MLRFLPRKTDPVSDSGQRPITYKAVNLPEGLALSGGIVTGQIAEEGDYPITLIAENKLGFCENGKKVIHVLKKKLHNGDYALAVFNLGETVETVKVYLDEKTEIRDVWAKEDLAAAETVVLEEMHPHTVRMFRMKRC